MDMTMRMRVTVMRLRMFPKRRDNITDDLQLIADARLIVVATDITNIYTAQPIQICIIHKFDVRAPDTDYKVAKCLEMAVHNAIIHLYK